MKKFFTLFFLLSFAIGILKAEDGLPEGCLYTSLGEVTDYSLWSNPRFPHISEVKVEAYEGYTIIRGWAGVENYDILVEFDANANILSITPIVNGKDGETVTSGYLTINTGREDIESINAYIGSGYSYATQYEGESGYVIFSCYLGEEWTYYYCRWPQQGEWVNPFEGEATLLYSAVGKTGEWAEWGTTVFPVVENIKVDVFDKYMYIHALGGVEGYDVKVAYDDKENVSSVITIKNGEESEPASDFAYIYTGRDDKYCLETYFTGYSYASTYEDKSGYVILGCNIYNPDNTSDWSYYYLSWEGETINSVDITNKFTNCWNESEKLSVGEDGSITYNGVQWGGAAAWFGEVDWSAYDRIVFEFAEPTTIASQIFVQTTTEDIKEWVNAGATTASCSFEGKNVSAVTQIALQAADEGTLVIKRVYLVSKSDTGIQIVESDYRNDGVIYNLSGQKVSADYKGIVIKNGKKVIQTGK